MMTQHTKRPSRSQRSLSVSRGVILAVVTILCATFLRVTGALAQAEPTASRAGDLQIGASFSYGRSVNSQVIPSTRITLPGFAIYGTFDKAPHFGIEASYRQIDNGGGSQIYERTYEIGGRAVQHFRSSKLNPYVKLLYGRGVYNYRDNAANLAYNIYTAGLGSDFHVSHLINVRVDYEYQTWASFPRDTLHPNVLSIGVAYHIPPDCRSFICAARPRR